MEHLKGASFRQVLALPDQHNAKIERFAMDKHTRAYCERSKIVDVKSFITLDPVL